MHERSDQVELLAFIEGELSAAEVLSVRRRLANEPRVLAAIDRIRDDRAALRSLPEPEMPEDFMSRLEPVLARAMLTEPITATTSPQYAKPGEFRRQYRRQHMRIRWDRIAVAAVLLIGVFAGTWATVIGLMKSPNQLGDQRLAMSENTIGDAANVLANQKSMLAETGAIHHGLHKLIDHQSMLAFNDRPNNAETTVDHEKSMPTVVAGFAIVISTRDAAMSEAAMMAAASLPEGRGALVRNFSFAEATRLAEEWRLAQAGRSGESEDPLRVTAGTRDARTQSPSELAALAQRVRQRLNASNDAGSTRASSQSNADSAQLAGNPELAPSLEQQLNFSQQGATHSIAVPAADLNALIERLALSHGQRTTLRIAPASEKNSDLTRVNDASQQLSAWLKDSAMVRQELERLTLTPRGTLVLVPVVVIADRN